MTDTALAPHVDSVLRESAELFGTPCYVYFADAISTRTQALKTAFQGRFSLSYAAKCNPNPELLKRLIHQVDFLDVSSVGEMRLGLAAGWAADRISFTGPGKREHEIIEAVEAGIGDLVVESASQALRANEIALRLNRIQDVLVRLSPAEVPRGFGDHMAGRPSPFGLDVEDLKKELPTILALPNLRIKGLHIYSGTQCLKPEALIENYRKFIGIFVDTCNQYDLYPEMLVFGSGLGIPYHEGDKPLPLEGLARQTIPELDSLTNGYRFKGTKLVLELGRYLVGEAGYFVTKVVSVKTSRGARIAICDGGMNNHLPASGHFGMVVRRNYLMHKVGGGEPAEAVDIVGPLCTSIDRLATRVMLPRLEEGDLLAIHNSGAYGLTASPVHFISHSVPSEVIAERNTLINANRQLTPTDITGS
jgi:diaminopimelate decarboxylase